MAQCKTATAVNQVLHLLAPDSCFLSCATCFLSNKPLRRFSLPKRPILPEFWTQQEGTTTQMLIRMLRLLPTLLVMRLLQSRSEPEYMDRCYGHPTLN